MLPMNTGAEAVETAIKVARKWGYQVKGVAAGPGPDRGRGRQLPRPHHHDRQLLHRPGRPRRLRPVHARLRRRAVRRRRRAARGDQPGHGGRADRADPGRGRACSCRRPATWPRSATICDEAGVLFIADEIQSGLGRTGDLLATRPRASTPTCTCWARRSAAASCRCRRSSPTPTCSACCGRASTAPPSAATRWPARSAGRWSSCWPTGPEACSARARRLGRAAARPAARAGRARGASRCAASGCGPASTSTRRCGPGGRSARRLARRGVLAKDTHGSTIRLAPPLVISEGELDLAVDVLAEVLTES